MKLLVKMVDTRLRVVASKEIDVPDDITDEGIKIVERSQNEVLRSINFQGNCVIEKVQRNDLPKLS